MMMILKNLMTLKTIIQMKKINFEELSKLSNVNQLKKLISFNERIPKDKWIINTYEYNGSHCFLGHCGIKNYMSTHLNNTHTSILKVIYNLTYSLYNNSWEKRIDVFIQHV